jgi:hypothetical protein
VPATVLMGASKGGFGSCSNEEKETVSIDTSAFRGSALAAQIDALLADSVDTVPHVIVLATSMWVALCAYSGERLMAYRGVPIYIAGGLSEPEVLPMGELVSAAQATESHELSCRWNQSQWDALNSC